MTEIEDPDYISANLPERKKNKVHRRKHRTGKEFRLDAQVLGYNRKDVMLDLGLDVNILLNKSWEAMGPAEASLFSHPSAHGKLVPDLSDWETVGCRSIYCGSENLI